MPAFQWKGKTCATYGDSEVFESLSLQDRRQLYLEGIVFYFAKFAGANGLNGVASTQNDPGGNLISAFNRLEGLRQIEAEIKALADAKEVTP